MSSAEPGMHKRASPNALGAPIAHDSAWLHVSGKAQYIDDIPDAAGTLYAALGLSPVACGTLSALDLDDVRAHPGVVAVLTAHDIPGENNFGSVIKDDPILANGSVHYVGQPIFAVLAESVDAARMAARKARITIAESPPVLDIDTSLALQAFVSPPVFLANGDAAKALAGAAHRIKRVFEAGGQEHFYLEGQVAVAQPGSADEMILWSSTQHPGEVQQLAAHMLGVPLHSISVNCRRMGGAFGGKETQAAQFACIAALGAHHTGRAVKLRVDRDEDFRITGKRHAFRFDYEVGFDETGRVQGFDVKLYSECGYSADMSAQVNDRAVLHVDNAYFLPDISIASYRCRTNTQSATAFRGFGGPQGMFPIEHAMDEIAAFLGLDPLQVRQQNFYRPDRPEERTPYGMEVDDNVLPQIIETLAASSDYQQRCLSLRQWNAANPIKKRGLGWMPVKYGIAYNAIFLNQASAIVNIYTDGSVTVNHGGTEMGQGLFVKVAQVVAHVLGIGTERVKPTTSDTGRIPNASATSASSGTDLNGMAAYRAAVCLRDRLSAWVNQRHGRAADARVDFVDGEVRVGDTCMSFAELVRAAYFDRIQLTALGYYTVPKIHYNTPGQLSGRPYYYFTYGAALTEVQVDLRTGELEILRVDALQDAGVSINPAVDLGQIEGGIVQGFGWLTTEELSRDHHGRLLTHSPSTYKIPLATDVPPDFRAELWASGVNREKTIFRSKATGEPPFSLAMSVYSAVRWALASAAGGMLPAIDAPLSAERILFAAQRAASQTPVCVAPQLDLPPVTALTSRTPA